MRLRLLPAGLLLVAAVTGCSTGASAPSGRLEPGARDAAVGGAVHALETLPVKDRSPKTGYDRTAQFGSAWSDTSSAPGAHNGCDSRNDILRRDLKAIAYKGTSACVIASGRLTDPYTAADIDFVRGPRSSQVQIDHIVALSDSWQTGAALLPQDRREALANDPLNLLAASGTANRQKSDGNASTWLPANKDFRCTYVARQIAVKRKYHLWVDPAEKKAMQRVLTTCPRQTLPTDVSDGVTLNP
ncbi:HNH endonuclease family protein [Streptomyces sp. NPDC015125]|uniref:HNH endonuclease family protein n=1 Tax=Streptomyces sp. NPDC015125 TaxID=3364938 RepID=UPI0036FA5F3F